MTLLLSSSSHSLPRIDSDLDREERQTSYLSSPTPVPPASVSYTMLRKRTKMEVYQAYVNSLAKRGDVDTAAPGFLNDLKQHFNRLPTRYALDVNIESLDVLSHQRLLDEARSDPTTVSFAVRPVEVVVQRSRDLSGSPVRRTLCDNVLPKPAFGSSPNLQALAIEAGEKLLDSSPLEDMPSPSGYHDGEHMAFYEITVASADQPKLLSRLSEALSDLGLNIREAHAFNTNDGFSLDVFVVDQIADQSNANLEEMLGARLAQMPHISASSGTAAVATASLRLPPDVPAGEEAMNLLNGGRPASPAVDDWEIDIAQLQIDAKVASGALR